MKFTHMRRIQLQELHAKSFDELVNLAAAQNILVQSNISKWELIVQLLRVGYNAGAQLSVAGTLKVHPRGFGMIRIRLADLDLELPSDVYLAPSKIQSLSLKDGDTVFASIRPPQAEESYFSVKALLTA